MLALRKLLCVAAGRWATRTILFAAATLAVFSSAPVPASAADNWQAYTYWGTPTVVASRNFRKLTEDNCR